MFNLAARATWVPSLFKSRPALGLLSGRKSARVTASSIRRPIFGVSNTAYGDIVDQQPAAEWPGDRPDDHV